MAATASSTSRPPPGPAPQAGAGRFDGFDARDLLVASLLGLLGAALRVLSWKQTVVMFNDGPRFLLQARHFADGKWEEALADPYHPLYALSVAGMRLLLGGAEATPAQWERAAVAVSVLAGALSVVVFYVFLRSAFGRSAAWIGALLLACSPYAVEFSSDVQSDGLHQLLFLLAVAFAWSGLEQARPALAGWAGICAGLAYLARPEGLGVAAAAAAVAAGACLARRWSLPAALQWGAALLAGVLLVTAPYLVWLRVESGAWSLTRKKSVTALTGAIAAPDGPVALGEAPGAEVVFSREVMVLRHTWKMRQNDEAERRAVGAPPGPGPLARGWSALVEVLHALVSALRPEVVLVAVVGMLLCRGRPGLRGVFLLAVGVVYAVAVYGLQVNYGYVSRRHTLTPAVLLLGYAALAVPVIGRALLERARRALKWGRKPSIALATTMVVAFLVAFALGKLLRPQAPASVAERQAAAWVQSQPDLEGPVAAGKRRVAYYAGAPWFPLRKIPDGAPLVGALRSNGVRYVVADDGDVAAYPDLARPEGAGLRVVYRAGPEGGRAIVYEIEGG